MSFWFNYWQILRLNIISFEGSHAKLALPNFPAWKASQVLPDFHSKFERFLVLFAFLAKLSSVSKPNATKHDAGFRLNWMTTARWSFLGDYSFQEILQICHCFGVWIETISYSNWTSFRWKLSSGLRFVDSENPRSIQRIICFGNKHSFCMAWAFHSQIPTKLE